MKNSIPAFCNSLLPLLFQPFEQLGFVKVICYMIFMRAHLEPSFGGRRPVVIYFCDIRRGGVNVFKPSVTSRESHSF